MTKVKIGQLEIGTEILIETKLSVYEITLVDQSGNCLITGSSEFLEETKILLIGCVGYKGHLVCGECIEFAFNDTNGKLGHGRTSPITSCRLTGKNTDGTKWHFEVWEKENESIGSS